jgi:hypothetical protein
MKLHSIRNLCGKAVQSALEGTHSTYALLCLSFAVLLDVPNSFNLSVRRPVLISSPVGTHDHVVILSKTFTCVEMGAFRTDPSTGSSIAVDGCWPSLAPVALMKTSTTLNPSFKIRRYNYYGFTMITYIDKGYFGCYL